MNKPESPAKFWLPTVISVIALTVSTLEAIDSRRARAVSVTPLIDFFVQDDESEHELGVSVKNNGPGVAQVKAIRYYIDHRPIADLGKALAAANVKPSAEHQVELEKGDSLAVGEAIWLLRFEFRAKDQQAAVKFSDYLDTRLGVELDYCSVDGARCATKCSTIGLCEAPTS